MELVLDGANVSVTDQLPAALTLRRQPPLTDPTTDRIRATFHPRGCLGDCQHGLDLTGGAG